MTIATMDGRYDSITISPAPDCRQPALRDDRADRRSSREDHRAASGMGIPGDDLQRQCRAEASARFDRRPSELTVNYPIRQSTGTTVQGWFEDGKRSTFFSCRFDADGRFLGVY